MVIANTIVFSDGNSKHCLDKDAIAVTISETGLFR